MVKCSTPRAAAVFLTDEHGLALKASVGMDKNFSTDGAIIAQFIKDKRVGNEGTISIYETIEEYPNERFGAVVRANGFGSMISVAIEYSGRLYGYIFAAYTDAESIHADEFPFFEAVSSIFGTYIGYITRFRSEYDVNSFLEMLINQLPVGVAVFDRSGTCRMINSTHKRFLGVETSDSIIGHFRVFEDDVLVDQGMITSIKKSYEGYSTEFIIQYDPSNIKKFAFKGIAKKLRIKAIPLYDSGGEISNIALLYDDISESEEGIEESG